MRNYEGIVLKLLAVQLPEMVLNYMVISVSKTRSTFRTEQNCLVHFGLHTPQKYTENDLLFENQQINRIQLNTLQNMKLSYSDVLQPTLIILLEHIGSKLVNLRYVAILL